MVRRSSDNSDGSLLRSVGAFGDSFSCSQFGASDLDLDENDFEAMAQEAEVTAQARLRRRQAKLGDSLVVHKGRLRNSLIDELLESEDENSCAPPVSDAREHQRSATSNDAQSKKWASRTFDRKGRRRTTISTVGTERSDRDSLEAETSTQESPPIPNSIAKTVCFDPPELVLRTAGLSGPLNGRDSAPGGQASGGDPAARGDYFTDDEASYESIGQNVRQGATPVAGEGGLSRRASTSNLPTTQATATLDPPQLMCFTLKRRPEDTKLGLRVRQMEDGAIAVVGVAPGGQAAATPLRPGVEILSIHDHRIKDAERCVRMFDYYRSRDVEIVASDGVRPPGASYVMVKRGDARGRAKAPRDSFHGLMLEEDSGRVRVAGFGKAGLFLDSRIDKGDVLLSFDGRPIRSIEDCWRALKKVTRSLIPVLTYKAVG